MLREVKPSGQGPSIVALREVNDDIGFAITQSMRPTEQQPPLSLLNRPDRHRDVLIQPSSLHRDPLARCHNRPRQRQMGVNTCLHSEQLGGDVVRRCWDRAPALLRRQQRPKRDFSSQSLPAYS